MQRIENGPYYARHSLCIDNDLLAQMFREGKIAVHYGDEEEWDEWAAHMATSKKRWGKIAANILEKLNNEGGWVVADYSDVSYDQRPEPKNATTLVGCVVPGSLGLQKATKECQRYTDHGPTYGPIHVYKTLQLEDPARVSVDQYHILRLPFGQATICESHILTLDNVRRIYNHEPLTDHVGSLVSDELELLCHEYLRAYFNPRLEYLLETIGGQQKDIDINGEDSTGNRILAQVSHDFNEEKLSALTSHRATGVRLVYFGPKQSKLNVPEGVTYVNVEDVFDKMKSSSVFNRMIQRFLNPTRFGTA